MLLFLLLCLRASAAPNLVLISLDTTRYDAVSANGVLPGMQADFGAVTPNIDALAAEGLRFERFYAHAPTTLSSHASMLTGRDPHGHAIVRNGFPLPEGVPTLAERLRDVGYDTIAVVGAKALEQPMGLDRGFRIYDDHAPELQVLMYQDRADGVLRRAQSRLAQREADKPLFLLVHFYDPHAPYEAPGAFRERFCDPDYAGPYRQLGAGSFLALRQQLEAGRADPADLAYVAGRYAGEVGWTDLHVGRLLDRLQREGLLDEAVVVVVADHGEVLGEDPTYAYSHGSDVGEGVMRVPLVMRGYGVPLAERAVVRRQAEMRGLAPTLELALGLAPTLGRDFFELVRPGPVRDEDGWPERPTRPVFLEATRPHAHDVTRWNNLGLYRGVLAGGFALRGAPIFGQALSLEGALHAGRASGQLLERALSQMLSAWDAVAPPYRGEALGDETRAALQALGYLEE